tara:strand:- start:1596 stop:2540 length:945 start_codon:yes stop_codon:yes gene_type:complete
MIKLAIILKILIFSIFLNHSFAYSSIETSLIAKVGNQIISSYELKNKIKTILFLNNQELSQININVTKNQALRLLIDGKIKEEEIEKYSLSLKKENTLNRYLENIASAYGTNLEGLKQMFNDNNIDFKIYSEEIKTSILWNDLIFQLYGNKIILNENEVEDEIKEILKKNDNLIEFKLAEIELLFNNDKEKENKISNVKNQIKILGFENTAKKFSDSSTSQDGGSLGWINSKSLSGQIFNFVKDMRPGDVSQPIIRSNNVLFLKLIDKKKIDLNNENLITLRKRIINQKKSEYLKLFANNHLLKIRNNKFIEIK